MKMKNIIYVAVLIFLTACGTSANKLSMLSPGMSKESVVNTLGMPESVSAQGGNEVFIYTLSNSWNSPLWNEKYFVYFFNGKVVRYGK